MDKSNEYAYDARNVEERVWCVAYLKKKSMDAKWNARHMIFKVVQACYPPIKLYIHSSISIVGALPISFSKKQRIPFGESKPFQNFPRTT